jgi:hypothetical protein
MEAHGKVNLVVAELEVTDIYLAAIFSALQHTELYANLHTGAAFCMQRRLSFETLLGELK